MFAAAAAASIRHTGRSCCCFCTTTAVDRYDSCSHLTNYCGCCCRLDRIDDPIIDYYIHDSKDPALFHSLTNSIVSLIEQPLWCK